MAGGNGGGKWRGGKAGKSSTRTLPESNGCSDGNLAGREEKAGTAGGKKRREER